VVKPRDLGTAPQVITLLQALDVGGVDEELDREAERVLGPDRSPTPSVTPDGTRMVRAPSAA
jgi:hypothetical protein